VDAKEPRLRFPTATGVPADGVRMRPHDDQCRCSCGAMFARVVREGLEIKCRKCKAIVLITHDELVEMYRSLGFDPPPLPAGR
jgi:phage FluMu protein Com